MSNLFLYKLSKPSAHKFQFELVSEPDWDLIALKAIAAWKLENARICAASEDFKNRLDKS